MSLVQPTPPPFDPAMWVRRPFAERGRMVCEAWALQGYGTPPAIFVVYALKVLLFIGGWIFFCGLSPSLGGPSVDRLVVARAGGLPEGHRLEPALRDPRPRLRQRAARPAAYFPPVGGFLYFLRVGTTKLPLFPRPATARRRTRSPVDVLLYLGAPRRCSARPHRPASGYGALRAARRCWSRSLGVLDKTLFLAARGEHYWVTIVCFAFARNWIAGAKAVQIALWFWAGFSKLNHHFPTVVCVMTSNGPLTRFPWLRRRMYRDYPRDLRPSPLGHGRWLTGHRCSSSECRSRFF